MQTVLQVSPLSVEQFLNQLKARFTLYLAENYLSPLDLEKNT